MQFRIRQADAPEIGAVFALLPDLCREPLLPDNFLVAVTPPPGERVVGAAAFVPQPCDTRRSGFRCIAHVVPDYRRRGIGRALIRALANDVRHWDVPYLHAWRAFDEGPAADFLLAVGFEPLRRIRYFLGGTETTRDICRGHIEKLRARGKIPDHARACQLSDIDALSAARLYAGHFGCSTNQAMAALAESLGAPMTREISLGLRLGTESAGFILWQLDADGIPRVHLWIVHPRHRTGWAAVLLLEASLSRLVALGHAHARYHCNDEAAATLKIAARSGATLVRAERTYALAIDERAPAPQR